MNKCYFLLPVVVQSLLIAVPTYAADAEVNQKTTEKLPQVTSDIQNLSEIELPTTNAKLLTQSSALVD